MIGTVAATWTFTATDAHPGTTTCQIDSTTPVACDSTYTMRNVANGQHRLTITSTDAAGNSAAVVRRFSTNVTTTLTPTASTVTTTYGSVGALGVKITPAAATGHVRFALADGTWLCTAVLSSGAGACAAPQWQKAGSYSVTASYTGGYAASTTTLRLLITKAASAVTATRQPSPASIGNS